MEENTEEVVMPREDLRVYSISRMLDLTRSPLINTPDLPSETWFPRHVDVDDEEQSDSNGPKVNRKMLYTAQLLKQW